MTTPAPRPPFIEAHDGVRLGEQIGRYVVLRPLGAGGMGSVFLAYDPELDRRVAIKLLRSKRVMSNSRARLLREAQAMARLTHVNVVAVYDVGTFAGRVYITMEYVEGETLQRWMRQRRPWREVVDVFSMAGRGLEAAHAVGLVHRDFKPENVLSSLDGPIKVTDFGLVRSSGESSSSGGGDPALDIGGEDEGEGEGEGEGGPVGSSQPSEPGVFDTPLTRVGAVLGTPAYMSPEQFKGAAVDPRTDQFAFCASLYQGLFGELPFGGDSPKAIRTRVLGGDRSPFPEGHGVPAHVLAVLERGLEYDPEDRWPSMGALLAALADDPRRRRRRVLAGVVAALALGGVGVGALVQDSARARRIEAACVFDAARIEADWNEARREELRAGMGTFDRGGQTWGRAETELDAWVEGWRGARHGACMAESAGEPLAGAEARCLDGQLIAVGGTLDALDRMDRLSLVHAVEAIAELPVPGTCAEPARLTQGRSEGLVGRVSSAAGGRVERGLRRRLAEAETLNLATRYGEAGAVAEAVFHDPKSEGSPVLRARAQRIAAQAAHGDADYERAAELYEAAFHGAAREAEDPLALAACFGLVWLYADRAEFERAEQWAALAETLTARLGDRPGDLAQLYHRRGRLLQGQGAHAEAEAAYRAALTYIEKAHGQDYLANVKVLTKLAYVLRVQGKTEAIPSLYDRARTLATAHLGEEHPQLAMIALEQGKFEQDQGRPEAARAWLEASAAGLERSFGPAHPLLFDTVHALAMVDYDIGRLGEARRGFARAIAMASITYGADSPRLGQLIANAAVVSQDLGRTREALEAYAKGRALIEKGYGPDYDGLGYVDSAMGELHMELGEVELAKAELAEAKRIFTVALGPEHVMLTEPMRILGAGACDAGEAALGLGELRGALVLAERSDGPDHPENVAIMVALGRCEIVGGVPDAGRAYTRRALRVGEEHYEAGSVPLAQLYGEVSEAERLGGQLGRAREHAERALALFDALAAKGPDHAPAIAGVDARLGLALVLEASADAEGEGGGSDGQRAAELLSEARELLDSLESDELVDPRVVAMRRQTLAR